VLVCHIKLIHVAVGDTEGSVDCWDVRETCAKCSVVDEAIR